MIEPALASGGGGLPWEGPLEQIQESITGPVAGAGILLGATQIVGLFGSSGSSIGVPLEAHEQAPVVAPHG